GGALRPDRDGPALGSAARLPWRGTRSLARPLPSAKERGMKRAIFAGIAAVALTCAASGAQAQQIVYDPSAYAKLLQQAQTQLQQLEQLKAQIAQGKQLYDGFNQNSGVNG